jgi:hypothetical protein
VALVSLARPAWGADAYTYRVLLDTDNNSATGCGVLVEDSTVGSIEFSGVERLVSVAMARTGSDGTVTGITLQKCDGGTLGRRNR